MQPSYLPQDSGFEIDWMDRKSIQSLYGKTTTHNNLNSSSKSVGDTDVCVVQVCVRVGSVPYLIGSGRS